MRNSVPFILAVPDKGETVLLGALVDMLSLLRCSAASTPSIFGRAFSNSCARRSDALFVVGASSV